MQTELDRSFIDVPAGLAERLRDEALRLRTPLYAYDEERLERDAAAIRSAFPDRSWTRLYSLKANGLPGLVRRIAARGFGASAVSRGEIALALRAGLPPDRIALEGVGKTAADLRLAVELAAQGRPLLWVSVESMEEAESLADLAARSLPSRGRLDVLVRVNPSVEPETHAGLAVGRGTSKFGVAASEVADVIRAGGGTKGPLRWRGLHVHVGSQLASVEAWRTAMFHVLGHFAALKERHPELDTVDVGGGLPAGLADGPPPKDFADGYAEALRSIPASARPRRQAVEPGRSVIASSGWLVSRVLHVRDRGAAGSSGGGRQVVIDAGMTEIVRPALYGAEHPIVALTSLGTPVNGTSELSPVVVDGPICESTDRLGAALLPQMERGDLVAIGMAGAYASAMFSSYNGRPRPPEVYLERGGSRTVLRRRGSLLALP